MPNTNQTLNLYYYDACPFCVKVRQSIKQLSVIVGLCNTLENQYRQELIHYGGSSQVPCLRIEKKDKIYWLYESNDIIDYLQKI